MEEKKYDQEWLLHILISLEKNTDKILEELYTINKRLEKLNLLEQILNRIESSPSTTKEKVLKWLDITKKRL